MNLERAALWCDKAIRFSLYALIYFIPISIALIESFASAALFFFFIKRGFLCVHKFKSRASGASFWQNIKLFFLSFKPVSSVLSRPMALFIFVGFVSILISKYPPLSIQGFFFKLLEWTFLYFIFIEVMTEEKHLKVFLACFLLSSFVIALSGLSQQITGVDFIRGHKLSEGRISSSLRHANDLGAYLVVVAPLVFSLLSIKDRKKMKAHWLYVAGGVLLFFLLMVCLGLTYSRGAWFAFVVALIFLGFMYRSTFLIALLTTFIFIGVFVPNLESRRNLLLGAIKAQSDAESNPVSAEEGDKVAHQKDLFFEQSLGRSHGIFSYLYSPARDVFWSKAVGLIKQNPFGTGINTYSRASKDYFIQETNYSYGSGYPHNCYLQLTAEMGFLGLFAFMWILWELYWNSIRNLKNMNNRFLLSLTLGLLSGLFGFLVHSFVDTNFYSVQLGNYMWIVMGAIIAAQNICLKKPAQI